MLLFAYSPLGWGISVFLWFSSCFIATSVCFHTLCAFSKAFVCKAFLHLRLALFEGYYIREGLGWAMNKRYRGYRQLYVVSCQHYRVDQATFQLSSRMRLVRYDLVLGQINSLPDEQPGLPDPTAQGGDNSTTLNPKRKDSMNFPNGVIIQYPQRKQR